MILEKNTVVNTDRCRFPFDLKFSLFYNYLYGMSEYSIGDALKQFLNKSRLKGSMQALQIEDAWEKIMGKTIARYTEKIQIHGTSLYITTHMAPLKQELLFQKESIIQRVNEALGEKTIKEVVIL